MPIVLVLFLSAFAAEPDPEPYAWPLNLSRVLTSSFAEYRANRYHMGIDLRTGPIGKDVFAAAEGYVSRIRCSPYGYGKAIYLQLDDGNSVVYAHLDDFAPQLGAYVQRSQHDRQNYTVDLYPDPGRFRVTRGELIGKSGQTGIGVPHLHYEIRDRRGAPINPRLLGVRWPDSTAPAFRKAVVMPLDPETTVNGDFLPVVLDARSLGNGSYETGPVHVSGPVAIGVDVIDPANGGGTRLGVHTLVTSNGEEELFRMHHDRISYDHDQDGVVAYHPFLLDRGRFLMQWRWPGNESELYDHGSGDGRIAVADEARNVSVAAEDFHGNRANLRVPMLPDNTGAAANARGPSREPKVAFDALPEWLVVTAQFPDAEDEVPRLSVREPGQRFYSFRRVGPGTFRAVYDPALDTVDVLLTVDHSKISPEPHRFVVARRGQAETVHQLGDIQVRTHPDSPYGTFFLRVETVIETAGAALKSLGPAYRFSHVDTPIDAPIDIYVPRTEAAKSAARPYLFRKGRKNWEIQETGRFEEVLGTSTSRLGTFMVMEDAEGPKLKSLRPRDGSVTSTRRPEVRAIIEDAGSGIYKFSATLNGHWLLMEYDPEQRLLSWEQDEDLEPGPASIEFRATDGAGNTSVRTVQVEIGGAAGV